MSGGYFEYKQYELNAIADSIEQVIRDWEEKKMSEYDNIVKWDFRYPSTILELYNAMNICRKASIYAHRVDYLLSGDDGEENFHERLRHDMETMKTYEGKGRVD